MIKNNNTIINILVIILFVIQPNQLLAKEVIQIGVATPQVNQDIDNIEKLRERAIKNAMEMAVMQVTGVKITSEKGGLNSFHNTTNSIGGDTSRQISSFHTGVKTKTTGNVKVLKIIKEWQKNGSYFVEVKLEVANKKDLLKSLNIGDLWERADKPSITIDVATTKTNQHKQQAKLLQNYLQDNLNRNGVNITKSLNKTTKFNIQVRQIFSNSVFYELKTYKSNCNLSFSVIDNELNRSLADYTIGNDDVAGFSQYQSEESCTKGIAQKFSAKLLKELAVIFNNQWSNGGEFLVKLSALPGKHATKSSNIIANAYQVNGSQIQGFDDNKLSISVLYDGKGFELVDTINTAFIEAGIKVNLVNINGNQVEFIWLGVNE